MGSDKLSKLHRPKVVHMVTVATSLVLMKGQLSYLKNSGFDMTVVSGPGEELNKVKLHENVNIKAITMKRNISPINDLISLIKIIIFFIKLKPQICNSGTPKAGFLGMIAAWITRVPFKIYTIRGLPFEETSGLKRKILIFTEKIACACADKVICISPSLKNVVIKNNLTLESKTIVIGNGSSNGLQFEKFNKTKEIDYEIRKIKKEYNLSKYNFIIGYVGRINKHKGVEELIIAFENLQKKYKNIALIMVGESENKNAISDKIYHKIVTNPDIIKIGWVENTVPYYYIMDILAFPTYREGFGNVSIEAQATGTPVITTNVTGAVDTVVHGETGFVINVKDTIELEEGIEKFIVNRRLIKEMGEIAKKRVRENFDSKIIWTGLESLYRSGLEQR